MVLQIRVFHRELVVEARNNEYLHSIGLPIGILLVGILLLYFLPGP